MLVLERHIGESIMLGDNVKLTLHSIKGERCKLAIEAPSEVIVRRGEAHGIKRGPAATLGELTDELEENRNA